MGHFGDPWGTLASTLMFSGSTWDGFGGPWELLGLLLELLGTILGSLGHPKLTQSGPEWHLADTLETYENSWVLKGLRGWRLPSWHQNDVPEALVCYGPPFGLPQGTILVFLGHPWAIPGSSLAGWGSQG